MKLNFLQTSQNVTKLMKKNTPEMMIIGGVVGLIAAGVMACKATIKTQEVIDEHNECLDDVKADVDIPEDEKKKIITQQYAMTIGKVAKNYAGPVLVATASAALIFAANHEQNKRQAYLISAYTAVDGAFKKYRESVVAELGEEKDIQFKHGLHKEKIDIVEVDENGKEKKTKKEVLVGNTSNSPSEFARFFDESCPDYSKNPESNLLFLRLQQSWCNDKLKQQKHLFLNEVYDAIGLPRTQAGAVVGWLFDSEDKYVDFGIYDIWNERNRAFVNGTEPCILLDFNVDGVIYDKI